MNALAPKSCQARAGSRGQVQRTHSQPGWKRVPVDEKKRQYAASGAGNCKVSQAPVVQGNSVTATWHGWCSPLQIPSHHHLKAYTFTADS